MPTRPREFSPRYYYHTYNRGVEKRNIFTTAGDYQRFENMMTFYLHTRQISYAQYQELDKEKRHQYHELNPKGLKTLRVRVIAYCLMPNHIHLVLQPVRSNGVTTFMSDIANSHTRYFNLKNDRTGHLFGGPFKSKEIRSEESLMQVVRYTHLNPVMSSKTNPNETLKPEDYPFSSYREWLEINKLNPKGLIDQQQAQKWVEHMGGPGKYREFVESKIGQNPALGIESLIVEGD